MNWKDKLSLQGHRITQARDQMMTLLSQTPVPLTPMQIHTALCEQGNKMGLVSVYRNLELLARYDLVCLLVAPDGSAGYVAGASGHHHHILCRVCQTAAAFDACGDFEDLIKKVEAETGFVVGEHLLQFYGLCPKCKENNEKIRPNS